MANTKALKHRIPFSKKISALYYGAREYLNKLRLQGETRQGTFSRYYKSNFWKDNHSRSGEGSNKEQTQVIRKILPDILDRYNIQTLIDVPCGDFFWMNQVELRTVKYIGYDIVPEVIKKNTELFGSDQVRFSHRDMCQDLLDNCDMILCRDALVHLSFEDIQKALDNFKKSSAHYLLTTTFPKRSTNQDIVTGQWRTLNLQIDPFCFPDSLEIYNEGSTEQEGRYADKSIALWDLKSL